MTHGWQGESTDGPTDRWLELQWSPQLLDVVWCSTVVVVVVGVAVARWSCSCKL